jgi:hypothetical protein
LAEHRAPNALCRKLPANSTFKAMGYFNPEGYLCISLVLQESNIGPRSRSIAASNQNEFLHLLDSQFKLSGKGKPSIDMHHDALAKSLSRKSVLTLSRYWKG